MKRLTLRFAWYDLWVGVFVDTAKRTVYVCPLPCVLITWRYERRVLPPPGPRPDAPPVAPEWLAIPQRQGEFGVTA